MFNMRAAEVSTSYIHLKAPYRMKAGTNGDNELFRGWGRVSCERVHALNLSSQAAQSQRGLEGTLDRQGYTKKP